MTVVVDSWAWISKHGLDSRKLAALKKRLTVQPRKVGDYPGPKPGPLHLYEDRDLHIGVPRQYFYDENKGRHDVSLNVVDGAPWDPVVKFKGTLRPEQQRAITELMAAFRGGRLGGILQAAPGWGKTVAACALLAEIKVSTLIIVHKDFLMDQWRERMEEFLPGIQIGHVQQDKCDIEGKHVAMAMVSSLAARDYGDALYSWPGAVLVDEVHRIGAQSWSQVPPRFPSRLRIGLSATPRRKDRADKVFLHHIGPVLFKSSEKRLGFQVKRVHTNFRIVKTPNFTPDMITKGLMLRFLCASGDRNRKIVTTLIDAAVKGRKVMVLSIRLKHLHRLEDVFKEMWQAVKKSDPPSIGYYTGGMKKKALKESEKCQIIFATAQMCSEALDIPPLDTLFLVCPIGDVEQPVGRILRPCKGKKDPIVVDFRDPDVPMCVDSGEYRDRQYARLQS